MNHYDINIITKTLIITFTLKWQLTTEDYKSINWKKYFDTILWFCQKSKAECFSICMIFVWSLSDF